MQKIRGSIDGIDDEAVRLVAALDSAAFFQQKAVTGASARQFLEQYPLGPGMAVVTKSAGPFLDICRFSSSPKSQISARPAFFAAAIITFNDGER